jgi:hypothetical protein
MMHFFRDQGKYGISSLRDSLESVYRCGAAGENLAESVTFTEKLFFFGRASI